MSEEVPLVRYDKDGNREVIGKAIVRPEGVVLGKVSPEYAKAILGGDLSGFSIAEG